MPSEICKQCKDTRHQINGLYCIKLKTYVEHTKQVLCASLKEKDMNNEIAIVKQENIALIVQSAPQSYKDNSLSHDKCLEAGQQLLDLINQNGGNMTDELDRQAAIFIEKARKTIKKMNERRSPVTKLFDEVRTAFTTIENDIDPTKSNTVPYKLQQLRNAYATKKREEEEKRRQEEMAKQQAAQARERFTLDVEEDLKAQFHAELNRVINTLKDIDNSITLDNYDQLFSHIEKCSTELSTIWLNGLHASATVPYGINAGEAQNIEKSVIDKLSTQFKEQFSAEIGEMKTYILDRLPSKKANLERIAKANQEEAARLEAEMKKKEQEEAARLEQERAKREDEERKQAEMKKQAAEVGNLFTGQATMAQYQPKTKVSKKLRVLNPEGILSVITMWWSKEGCTLSVDELSKIFKKQLTFCEKLANKEGVFIQDESVEYVDDVKAK